MHQIRITLSAGEVSILAAVLQNGIAVQTAVGCSISRLLSTVFGVTANSIGKRAQTVLLNGKAVDHLDSAIVWDGATLALSPAMPGLAGAMLRRGGNLAPMRSGITHDETAVAGPPHRGTVSIKFFGTLIRELGFPLLERGICVRRSDLSVILGGMCRHLRKRRVAASVDGFPTTVAALLGPHGLTRIAGDALSILRVGEAAP